MNDQGKFSAKSASGAGLRSSNAVYGGNKVTVGMSTTSSMHSEDRMPNVIP